MRKNRDSKDKIKDNVEEKNLKENKDKSVTENEVGDVENNIESPSDDSLETDEEESKDLEVEDNLPMAVNKDLAVTDDGKKNKKVKGVKHLPKIFRKKYTVRRFQKKVLKRIYIPKDRDFVKSFFVQEETENPKKKGKLYIPADRTFYSKEVRRLRSIGKQIKKQKGRVKFMPLVAVFSFIFAIIFLIISFKNVLIARGIRSFFEYQFEARCDMASVNLKLLDSSFTIKGFEIANKDKPMENIFSFDSLIIDFDLNQLLKARAVAEELSLNGMNSGTKRSYDGTLPEHKLAKIRAKKEAKAKKAAENKEKVKTALNNATNQVKDNVTDSIVNIFNTFNPQIILESCYSQFKTPEMAKVIEDEAKIFVEKWKTTPDRVNVQVQNVKKSTEDIIYFDYASIKDDPKKIKDMLARFDAAFKTLDGVKTETESILADIQEDVHTVNDLLVGVKDSVTHDINVSKDKLDELKSFRLPSGQEFLASTIDIYGYELLGKYYPKIKQAVSYLIEMKGKQRPKKVVVKKEKKEGIKRAAGRNISFVNDYIPKFWIKKLAASGFNMEASVTNITNNMNMINKATEGVFKFNYKDIVHGGKVVVDIRDETENPLVYLEYTCDGTSFSHKDGIPGIPQIVSDADYICKARVYDDRPFVLSGTGNFYNLDLSTPYFEPAYVHDIYNSILGRFDTAEVGLEIEIAGLDSMKLRANTDLDAKIADAFKDEINQRLNDVKTAIEAELKAKIDMFKDKAMVIVDRLYVIEEKVHGLEQQLYELEDRLKEKQKEMENKLKAFQEEVENKIQEKSDAVKDGLQQEADKFKEKVEQDKAAAQQKREEKAEKFEEDLKKGVEDAASNALNNLFGGGGGGKNPFKKK